MEWLDDENRRSWIKKMRGEFNSRVKRADIYILPPHYEASDNNVFGETV